MTEQAEMFAAERARLLGLAGRILGDRTEAEDVVQDAWLRLDGSASDAAVANLPGWLTTVTTRLCLDRLRARRSVPVEEIRVAGSAPDPAEDMALADTVGAALQVVLDRLPPRERVAFVLHDSFGFAFDTIAAVLETTPSAARKLASRARARLGQPAREDQLTDWEVVDAFMAAARAGEFERLIRLLAPDVEVDADQAAIVLGTPERIVGRQDVAVFFNGAARAALAVYLADRPAAAWFHHGSAMVVFDFAVVDGEVRRITFRAEPETLAQVTRREGPKRRM